MGSSPLSYQHHLLLLSLLLHAHFSPSWEASAHDLPLAPPAEAPAPGPSFVLASCTGARYPSLCIRTLSSSRLPATSTPADLAIAAVSASHTSARSTATFLSRLLAASSPAVGPLHDCREQLADAADLLAATERELRRIRRKTSQRRLENALTWASAAMSNQDTCVDGIQEAGDDGAGEGAAVVERVSLVSQYTSNALHLIGRLGQAL